MVMCILLVVILFIFSNVRLWKFELKVVFCISLQFFTVIMNLQY